MSPTPIYTPENCTFCSPLRWGVTVFWRSPVRDAAWFDDLARVTEGDGIRLLGHRFSQPGVSQFVVSTRPDVSPALIVQRVKGRLQHLVRATQPRAFRRHFALRSFGRVTRRVVERYVASQLTHHYPADERVRQKLQPYQIVQGEVSLRPPRSTSHGQYWHDLHVVLVHLSRWEEWRDDILRDVGQMILKVCLKKDYWLSRAGVLPDHLHLALGCPFEVAPADVALAFLNNLAFVHGMKPVFQFGAFLGTFGEYDQRVVHSDASNEAGAGEEGDEP